MSTRRLVYVIMNFPVGGRPYVDKIVKANPYLTMMFGKTVAENSFMSKHDLERLGIFFPAGPRYKMFPYEMPEDFMTRENEPTGPSYTDYLRIKSLLGEELPKVADPSKPQ